MWKEVIFPVDVPQMNVISALHVAFELLLKQTFTDRRCCAGRTDGPSYTPDEAIERDITVCRPADTSDP
jgi:hypothetical protein